MCEWAEPAGRLRIDRNRMAIVMSSESTIGAINSAGEYYLHTVGVTGSIPVSPSEPKPGRVPGFVFQSLFTVVGS